MVYFKHPLEKITRISESDPFLFLFKDLKFISNTLPEVLSRQTFYSVRIHSQQEKPQDSLSSISLSQSPSTDQAFKVV